MTTGWLPFAGALAVFVLSHAVAVRPAVKGRLVGALGAPGFAVAYSALSVAALALVIVTAARAPYVPLWSRAPWHNHVVLAAMVPVCLLAGLAIGRPNPFSFGGSGNGRFDAARPGVVRWTRHPLLVALALWAAAHTLANPDVAHAGMFAALAAFSLLGMAMIDRRTQRIMGADAWHDLRRAVAAGPLVPRPASAAGAALRVAAGLLLYVLLILLHPTVIGVSPLPV